MLAVTGHPPLLWARDRRLLTEISTQRTNRQYLDDAPLHPDITAEPDLERLTRSCPVIFLVVPSTGFRDVAARMGDWLQGDQILIHAVKGLERDTFKRMSVILREETCCRKIGVLSGPNLARELIAGQPGATVIASRFGEVVAAGRDLLMSLHLRIYGSRDVTGVELAGALKNVIALAAGFVNGSGFGDNTKAMLLTRGMVEVTRFGTAHGALPDTFQGLAGMGDMMATCASPLSRNYNVGWRLAKGENWGQIKRSMTMIAEGVNTTRAVYFMAKSLDIDMPITAAMYRLLFTRAHPATLLRELMARKAKYETDPCAEQSLI